MDAAVAPFAVRARSRRHLRTTGCRASIGELLLDVRERGDAAVCDALARFDGIDIEPHQAPRERRRTRRRRRRPPMSTLPSMMRSLTCAPSTSVSSGSCEHWSFESEPGLVVGERISPISSVGLFTPSGKASYPSVAYQLAVPAVVAGVPEVALGPCPPIPGGAGEVDPAVLVVCRKLGIRTVARVNGPAGIAALGFGTESIPKRAQDRRSGLARRDRSRRSRCSATASPP